MSRGPRISASRETASAGLAEPHYRSLFRGIFALAFGTLVYEISLIRIFSFTIWHHLGYVVISTAMLGFGAAGTYLAVRPGSERRICEAPCSPAR